MAGGNIAMLAILATLHPEERDALTEKRKRTVLQLNQALSLTLEGNAKSGHITTQVVVNNHSGHLPDREFRQLWKRHGAPVRIAQATMVIPNRSTAEASPAE
jgi:hypothetical protein